MYFYAESSFTLHIQYLLWEVTDWERVLKKRAFQIFRSFLPVISRAVHNFWKNFLCVRAKNRFNDVQISRARSTSLGMQGGEVLPWYHHESEAKDWYQTPFTRRPKSDEAGAFLRTVVGDWSGHQGTLGSIPSLRWFSRFLFSRRKPTCGISARVSCIASIACTSQLIIRNTRKSLFSFSRCALLL